jgi:glycosyltransferase involved in cell wall biosynthesis
MSRLKVAFLTPSLYWGGAERWMLDLVRFSRQQLRWVGCAVASRINNDETMVRLFGELMPISGHSAKAARRIAQDADVALAWGDCGMENLGDLGRPIVWVGHGCGLYDRMAVHKAVGVATHFATVSEAGLDIYDGLVPIEHVRVVHNGIDPARCRATEARSQTRRRLGVRQGEWLVGYLGRMVPEKNPVLVAQAVALLPERYRACFVGGGWDLGRQRATIAHILGDRAIHVDRTEHVGDYYRAFDCFCLASPAEGFSMAMLEAMYCNTPCVLTRVGVLPELERRHGRHWISLEPGCSPKELAEAIRVVAEMPPQERRAMTDGAKKLLGEHFTARHMANRWVEFLSEVAEGAAETLCESR